MLLRFDGHRFAVKAFAWCKQYKCMASSGLDRDILLWDVTTGHSIGRLRGHQAPVAHLVYSERQDNLFSLDQRHYMLVWDVSKQVLLSRIDTDEGDPYFNYHAFRAGSLLINQRRGHIVLCARRPFVWTVRALENADDIGLSSHSTALLATLYSPVLEQIGNEADVTYVDVLRDDDLPGDPGEPEHSWLGLMRFNFVTMVEALGGDASALEAVELSTHIDNAEYPQ